MDHEILMNYDSIKETYDEDISHKFDTITDNDFTELITQIICRPNQVNILIFWSPWVNKSHKTISIAQKAMH